MWNCAILDLKWGEVFWKTVLTRRHFSREEEGKWRRGADRARKRERIDDQGNAVCLILALMQYFLANVITKSRISVLHDVFTKTKRVALSTVFKFIKGCGFLLFL